MYALLGIFVYLTGQVVGQTVPCGVPVVKASLSKRIVGGKEAIPGSWPWMVMIVDDLDYVSGSGAIIGPNVILTSAQHFRGDHFNESTINLSRWKLFLGAHNISKDVVGPYQKAYRIESVKVHEKFGVQHLENDIALIFTNETIVFNDHTRPLCLSDSNHLYSIGQMCYLAGWGSAKSIHGSGKKNVLNQVDLPIKSDDVCRKRYRDFLPATEICAGYKLDLVNYKDFCADDIGGPLMCQDTNGIWYAQGIASSGGTCSYAQDPGIFEDVSEYTGWIKNNMKTIGYNYQYQTHLILPYV